MKQTLHCVTLAVLISVGTVGCGKNDSDELRNQIAELKATCDATLSELVTKDEQLSLLRVNVEQKQAIIDALTSEQVKMKVEMTNLKQEFALLRRKTK